MQDKPDHIKKIYPNLGGARIIAIAAAELTKRRLMDEERHTVINRDDAILACDVAIDYLNRDPVAYLVVNKATGKHVSASVRHPEDAHFMCDDYAIIPLIVGTYKTGDENG
ncbi:hypothetical protein [Morganella phage Mecenats66]|nr:hypothetical protein [Morganella phage Mecenats66]